MANNSSSSGGIGLAGALGLLFIGLKLGNVIAWPWIWVLSPFWIPLAFVGACAVLIVLIGVKRAILR